MQIALGSNFITGIFIKELKIDSFVKLILMAKLLSAMFHLLVV